MPAAYWWDPINLNVNGVYSSADPQNWLKGSGYPYVRYSQSEPAPGPTDDLYFLGGLSSDDCTIPQPADPAPYAVSFAGIHLLFGPINLGTVVGTPGVPLPPPPPPVAYTGTVTTAGSFAVGTLEVDCGTIKQADPSAPTGTAGTLTITSTLDWTGGTLNSNTVAGTIALAPGATGIAEPSFTNPGINGTVTLGSTLELLGTPAEPGPNPTPGVGSSLTVLSGTFNITAGVGFIAGAMSSLALKVSTPKGDLILNKEVQNKPGPVVDVKQGATALITCFRPEGNTAFATVLVNSSDGEVKFLNDGTTSITDRTYLQLGTTTASVESGYLQEEGGNPTTNLQAGSAIVCVDRASVVIGTGTLAIKNLTDSSGTAVADQPEAKIITSGDERDPNLPAYRTGLYLLSNATLDLRGLKFNKLSVRGTFDWVGDLRASLSQVTDDCDRIDVSLNVVVNALSAKLTLTWADDAITLPTDVDQFTFIQAINGISDDPPEATTTPWGAGFDLDVGRFEFNTEMRAYRHTN